MKRIFNFLSVFTLLFVVGCGTTAKNDEQAVEQTEEVVINTLFGVPSDGYDIERKEIKAGQSLSTLLSPYGVSALTIDRIDKLSRDIFPLRNLRAGNPYNLFLKSDSLGRSVADYFVYESTLTEYVVFGLVGDSVTITKGEKPTRVERQKRSAVITSSLWGAIMEAELPYILAAQLEDVYQWTVDFFGIQKGDSFTVIYDEIFVEDTVSVGVGRIWGAKFSQASKTYYAIPFRQGDKVEYWEADGGSLRKQMLKAPLKYSRISSKFSRARLHPIYKVYRPHLGVDYAAPTGTPVHAVADGVVVYKGWGGGGGNTLKIKHANKMQTGYLHLSRYAKGINKGSRVSQGQTIGYVGSTGASTGPHLDYRVWRNGEAIDPLKIPQEPSVPISQENREAFEYVKKHIMAELDGDLGSSIVITNLDSLKIEKITPTTDAE
ncbi:MAG: peptidoglycan DD-metalloendopeptidase family protein [Rikenellaceae bacterium]